MESKYTFKDPNSEKIQKCKVTGAVRSFFGSEYLGNKPNYYKTKNAKETCDSFLEENVDLINLKDVKYFQPYECEGNITKSITYNQMYYNKTRDEEIPIYGKQIVVSVDKETEDVVSLVNQIDYEINNNLSLGPAKLTAQEAIEIVKTKCKNIFSSVEFNEPKLYVYRHNVSKTKYNKPRYSKTLRLSGEGKQGEVYLVWQILLDAKRKRSDKSFWYGEILVDAVNGNIVLVKNRCQYATRPGFVFYPDPITTSKNRTLCHPQKNGTKDEIMIEKINKERREVVLENLDEPSYKFFRLDGKWIKSKDIKDVPGQFAPPVSKDDFMYGIEDREFASVMAYYWIDRLVEYLRQFNVKQFNDAVDKTKIVLDAQGNASFFHTRTEKGEVIPYIVFDENNVPGATDAHVIVHEYGHAIHWYMGKKQESSGLEEGFGDFLAGVWLDRFNEHLFQRENVFPWDNNPTDASDVMLHRFFTTVRKFSDLQFSEYGSHLKGSIIAAALWDLYLLMGGNLLDYKDYELRKEAADKAIRLYLETLVCLPENASIKEFVQGLIETDKRLYKGANVSDIKASFAARGLRLRL